MIYALLLLALAVAGCVERPAATTEEQHYFILLLGGHQYGPFATEAGCNAIRAEVERVLRARQYNATEIGLSSCWRGR